MAENLLQIMYLSRSVIPTDSGQFEHAMHGILQASARNNRPARLTGALAYDRGRFLQWIEGPAEAVFDRFKAIAQDPRHTDIEVVVKQMASARRFPQWQMAFTHVGEAAIYRLSGMPLADESPERLTDFIEAAVTDASTLSIAA